MTALGRIREAARSADLVRLLEHDARMLERSGGQVRTLCPFHEERTPSCYVYDRDVPHHLHCYGCGAHGDAVDYLVQARGLSTDEACDLILGDTAPRAKRGRQRWHSIVPAPDKAPQPTPGALAHFRYGDPVALWPYLSLDGASVLAVDARYQYWSTVKALAPGDRARLAGREWTVDAAIDPAPDGVEVRKKQVITWSWCYNEDRGEERWYNRRPLPPLPLYGLEQLGPIDRRVLVCEGAKAATAARRWFPDDACIAWMGGASNVAEFDRHDWTPLVGRAVTIWPDADAPGRAAADQIARHLRSIARSLRIVDTDGLPDGWDLADG